ncbi:iron-sulfur cluster repair di-iron protein [Aquiflexum gelatinilyticum]|uniref:Iron-sulfur cluster repair di-iron protein n=1 Tax=Aquiflexum gelatinilyticum TaxID=2961943 RepID=A0A9X2P564_9BACT|nr:iron-sulfur cluster repair di-iron protein [Aquiflexum gelatinilyticum]MCR9013830.1 iron-sulfur cluster repair di-iron protein [Aquiflexum gelatinilyticum]
MENLSKRKVGGIVAENFRAAIVFTEYGIDFCCKGGITLEKACEVNDVSMENILKDLENAVFQPEEIHFADLGLTDLINHITLTHHSYVENSIPPLKAYLQKLVLVHGGKHPELAEIKDHFFLAADALTIHMKKEELILFPYIKAMEEAISSHFHLSKPHFGVIENPIHMMEDEHETEGERFRLISELTGGYRTPADGCQTYKVAFAMLQEFEEDLHKHIHLENNILFPKATELFHKLNP